jgi:hypothetical protein
VPQRHFGQFISTLKYLVEVWKRAAIFDVCASASSGLVLRHAVNLREGFRVHHWLGA